MFITVNVNDHCPSSVTVSIVDKFSHERVFDTWIIILWLDNAHLRFNTNYRSSLQNLTTQVPVRTALSWCNPCISGPFRSCSPELAEVHTAWRLATAELLATRRFANRRDHRRRETATDIYSPAGTSQMIIRFSHNAYSVQPQQICNWNQSKLTISRHIENRAIWLHFSFSYFKWKRSHSPSNFMKVQRPSTANAKLN